VIPHDVLVRGEEAVALYKRALKNGASPAFAEMAACQMPPGTKGSDRAFMQGRMDGSWMNSMPKPLADRMVRQARAAGINTTGKFYMGGLADKRRHMDPEAWVDSVDDVRRVARKRNLEVRGIVDYTPPEQEPKKSVDIAPDILEENVRKELKKDPQASREEAADRVKKRIVPRWKNK
jgi:hypothetical protein